MQPWQTSLYFISLHWRLSLKFYLVQLVAFAVIILLSSILQQFTVLHNVGCYCSTCKRLCTAGRLHLMPPFKHWRHTMPALIMRPALTISSKWSICRMRTDKWLISRILSVRIRTDNSLEISHLSVQIYTDNNTEPFTIVPGFDRQQPLADRHWHYRRSQYHINSQVNTRINRLPTKSTAVR